MLSWLLVCLLGLLLMKNAESVKHRDFKTCLQSGFCNRNRVLAERIMNDGLKMPWRAAGITVNGPELSFVLSRSNFEASLTATITALENGVLKFSIEPSEGQDTRYRIPKGDVVVDDRAASNVQFVTDHDNTFSLNDGRNLTIEIIEAPFSVSLASKEDGVLLQLNEKSLFNYENGKSVPLQEIVAGLSDTDSQSLWREPSFNGAQDALKHGHQSFGMDIAFTNSEALYGIPEHASSLALKSTRTVPLTTGKVFSKSDPYRLFNLDVFEYELDSAMALYGAIPIMIGHNPRASKYKSVGVFWNNPSETWIDLFDRTKEAGHVTHWMSESGSLEVFIFAEKNVKKLQEKIRLLTGPPQLPPLFSLGYHQCRWNYKSMADVLEVHQKFDEHALPVDVIWLDIEHTDGKKYFTWNSKDFSDPDGMLKTLASHGRKMVTIVDPHIKLDSSYDVYNEVVDKGFAVKESEGLSPFEGKCWPGQSVWTDYTNPKARDWWSSLFTFDKYKGSHDNLFIWNDMNEPSVFESPEITMPRNNIHHQGVEHRDVHNLYGKYQQMSTFKGLLERSAGRMRPFLLSRSFYAGSQQFGAIWTGDNAARWDHLSASGPMLLSLGVVGYPFAGADVGGFFGNPSTDLLVRWYQAGAMQPFFRAHAHIETKRREPWLFGEVVTSQIRKILRLRYALLPLWYTAFEESSRLGVPPMRPMFLEFPETSLITVDDQWMIGPSLLFKPITKPDVSKEQVYLPEGSLWYSYFDLKPRSVARNEGDLGSNFIVEDELTLDSMLLYIRAGTVFARKDTPRRSTQAMKYDPYTLLLALDQEGQASGSLYVDDGESFEYKNNGSFSRLSFKATVSADGSRVELAVDLVSGNPESVNAGLTANRVIIIRESGWIEAKETISFKHSFTYTLSI